MPAQRAPSALSVGAGGWPTDRRFERTALVLAVAMFALGILAGACHEVGGYREADFYGQYGPQALSLARGEAPELLNSGPGYPALLAVASWFTDNLYLAAKLIAALSTALLGYLSYLTLRSFAAAGAGLLVQVMVYVLLFRFSFFAGNDVFCAALSLAALYFLLRRSTPSVPDLLLAGGFAGVATITRLPALALIAAGLLRLLVLPEPGRRKALRWRDSGLFLGAAVLLSSPWWIASTVWYGSPFASNVHGLIALEVFGAADERLSVADFHLMLERFPTLSDVLTHDPMAMLRYYPLDFYRDANQMLVDTVTLPAFLFLGVGLILMLLPGRSDRRRMLCLLLYAVLGFAATALVPYQARYYYPLLPVLLLPVAVALLHRWETTASSAFPLGWVRALALGSVLLVMLGISAIKTHEYQTTEPLELLEAAATLREHADADSAVASRKPHIAFMGRTRFEPLPPRWPSTGIVPWLRDVVNARFLYVGPQEVRTFDNLRPLAEARDIPDGLRLLHRNEHPAACLYVVE